MLPDGVWQGIWEWYSTQTFRLARELTATSRAALQQAIQEFADRPMTVGELRETVAHVFGEDRAARIATTEVTRAYTAAGNAAADELRAAGFEINDVWYTTGSPCSLCDHEGEKRGEGWSEDPPLHPNCLCRVEHEIA